MRETQTSFRLAEVMARKSLCVMVRSPNKRGPPNFGIHTQNIWVELSQRLNADVDRSHPKQPATNPDWPVGLDSLSKVALEGFFQRLLLVANLDDTQSLKRFQSDGANMSERRLISRRLFNIAVLTPFSRGGRPPCVTNVTARKQMPSFLMLCVIC